MTTDDGLTEDEALARLLATGMTYVAAGEALGLSEATVWRRMQAPKFRKRVDAERGLHVDTIVVRLGIAANDAVRLLHTVCTDAAAPLPVRVRAATEILGQLARWQDHERKRTLPPRSMAEHDADLMDYLS